MVHCVPDEAPLIVNAVVDAGVAQVTLRGELDLDQASTLAEELFAFAGRGATAVTVDVSGLNFIDSSGLRALLSAREQLESAGTPFRLTNVSAAVDRVLEMTGTRALLVTD